MAAPAPPRLRTPRSQHPHLLGPSRPHRADRAGAGQRRRRRARVGALDRGAIRPPFHGRRGGFARGLHGRIPASPVDGRRGNPAHRRLAVGGPARLGARRRRPSSTYWPFCRSTSSSSNPTDLRVFALLRLVRFFKLVRYSSGLASLVEAIYVERHALLASLLILGGLVLTMATLMHLAERERRSRTVTARSPTPCGGPS